MGINISKEKHFSHNITVKGDDGREQRVAVLNGRMTPGESMSLSLLVNDSTRAMVNREDIAAALDEFWTELREMAAENGLPV